MLDLSSFDFSVIILFHTRALPSSSDRHVSNLSSIFSSRITIIFPKICWPASIWLAKRKDTNTIIVFLLLLDITKVNHQERKIRKCGGIHLLYFIILFYRHFNFFQYIVISNFVQRVTLRILHLTYFVYFKCNMCKEIARKNKCTVIIII